MDRRQFLSSSVALAGAGLFSRRGAAATPPNILFIHVDEMRFPTVFPSGISDAGGFLAKFMPKTFKLWQSGVKFANHHTAAAACSPSRGVFTTGLYAHQHWVTQTVRNFPGINVSQSPQPSLDPAFPTFGSLLQQAGYRTPYFGKWHISIPVAPPTGTGLTAYGFDDMTFPDNIGLNLQGSVGFEPDFHSDEFIANKAAAWLGERTAGESPWCLTVGFVNPHDKAWFWAGTEYQTYAGLFPSGSAKPPEIVDWSKQDVAKDIQWSQNPLKAPSSFGYPIVPPNWETAKQIAAKKPSTQTFWRLYTQAAWGGISDDPRQATFSTARYPKVPAGKFSMAFAPFTYWQRGLDLYTQVMQLVDVQIGKVVDALPSAVAHNTVIVLTADHGDYAGAHGFTSDKMGSCYREITSVPLIVVDPTGQFTGDVDTVRDQLTSSVDLVPMLVSLAHNGSTDWIAGNLAKVYGRRHDMIPMLKSAGAAGRRYVLFTSEELAPRFNFNNSPAHIVAMVTEKAKLGLYSHWLPSTTTIDPESIEIEFYDYGTAGGRDELDNTPDDPRAKRMQQRLLNEIIPSELEALLPPPFRRAQAKARRKAIAYETIASELAFLETGGIAAF
jgi:arylsulfatase A-like enzyme